MISYSVYRLVHLFGIFLLLVVLGGMSWGARRAGSAGSPSPRVGMILHGLALFIVLLGGFGLLARIGVMHGMDWPGWVWAKLGIWLALGAVVIIPRRKPAWGTPLLFSLPIIGGLAAWLAIFKPF